MEALIEKLIRWLLKLLHLRARREKEKSQRVIEYIDQCLMHMRTVMHQNGLHDSEVEYAHTWLKQAHFDLPNIVKNLATPKECDILRQSLISARVFYHAVRYGKVDEERIKNDYEERFTRYVCQVYDQNSFRKNSNETILRDLVRDGEVIQESERKRILENLMTVCMEDIARIDSLKEQLKTRQVYVVTS